VRQRMEQRHQSNDEAAIDQAGAEQ
jgi:hypothetical protein